MSKPTEVSLAEVIAVLRRNILKILGCAVGTALVAGVAALLVPKAYRASTDLLVLKPTFKESEADFSEFVPETLSMPTCELLLMSDGLVEEVFAKSGVGEEEKELTIEEFRRNLDTKTRVERDTSYETLYSPVITLYATARTPETAKRIVDTWAGLFVERAKEIQFFEASNAYEFIRNEFDDVEKSLQGAEEMLRDFELENNVDRIKIEKEKQEQLLTQLQAQVANIAVKLAATEDKLAKLEEEKSKLPTTLSLAKAITEDAMWLSWIEQKRGEPLPEELKGASLITQELNPTRIAIEQEIVIAQGEVSNYRGELRMTNEKIEEVKRYIETLQQQLAEATMQSNRLTRDVTDYTTTHELLVTERDKAKIAAGRTMGDVRVWAPAVLPEKAVFPRNKKLVVVLGFLIGFVISSGYFLARYTVTQPQAAPGTG